MSKKMSPAPLSTSLSYKVVVKSRADMNLKRGLQNANLVVFEHVWTPSHQNLSENS